MSDTYIVSARKYRPQRFDEVVGQESTTQTLKNAIKNKQLAHSFLFCGSRGVGKTTIARILAKTINCKDLQSDGEACNQCDSCTTFNKNTSFNIIELDAASKNSVEDIRGLVEQVQYPPQNAEFKIFIIDEVHMLSQSAFNAFLKTLEEPPSYAKFILATTEKHKILPTILSRCQIYDFKRIQVVDIQNHLKSICEKEHVISDDKSLNLIAQKADGGLRDALSMFDRLVSMNDRNLDYQSVLKNLNILDHEVYFKFIEHIQGEDSGQLLILLSDVLAKGFDLDIFLSGFSEHIRNVWVAKRESTLTLLDHDTEIKQKFIVQSKSIEETTLLNLLQIITDCEVQLKSSRNRRLVVELGLLKMSYLNKLSNSSWTNLEEKKKLASSPLVEKKELPNLIHEPERKVESETTQTIVRGINLADLQEKVKLPKEEEVTQEHIAEIDEKNIWVSILDKFEGNQMELEIIQELNPIFENGIFTIKHNSESYAKLIENQFNKLNEIYKKLTGKSAKWVCEVEANSNEPIDLSKKEKFDELADRFPILNSINESFKLDFT